MSNGSPVVSMDEITISDFRGIHELRLAGMNRVSLLVGGNDTGKTTILEALELIASPLDPMRWREIASARARAGRLIGGLPLPERVSSMFRRTPGETEGSFRIRGRGPGAVLNLEATIQEIRGVPLFEGSAGARARDTEEQRGVRVVAVLDGDEHATASMDFWVRAPSVAHDRPRPRLRSAHIRAAQRESNALAERFSRLRAAGEDERIADLLHALDPRIEGIDLLTFDESYAPTLHLRDAEAGVLPLSSFGDGIQRAVVLALAVHAARGGLLLVDEIESALHPSALTRMFDWLQLVCARERTQLVATTHSLEAIDAILASDPTPDHEDIVVFKLERTKDRTIHARRYEEQQLRRLRNERGFDVR